MKKERLASEIVSDFIKLLDKANTMYQSAYDMVGNEDKKSSDILHEFELKKLTASEKAKLGTQLQKNRKNRRYWKDITQVLLPIVDLLKENAVNTSLNKTKQMLGYLRKAEENLEDRYYIYRVLEVNNNDIKRN